MADTRTQNGTRNIIAGVINRVILLFLPFLVRSAMVVTLGNSYLGLSSLFTSILTVLNLSELGFGAALAYSMYKPVAENDKQRICTILGYYKKIYRIISIAVLSAGTVLLPFLPQFIGGEWPKEINIYVLYYIYLINVVLSYALFAHKRALLTVYQRYDIITNINTVLSIGMYTIQIVLLFVTSNYYLYVCILPLFAIIDNLWVAFVTKKAFPDLECKAAISQEDRNAIRKHVKGLGIQKLCSTSRNSFDSIIISMNLGLAATAVYNNYYSIMLAVHMFLYQIPNAVRASVGNSIASENRCKNFKNYSLFNFIYMWISGWCTICLLCLFQPFMQIWMGNENMFPEKTVILYCIYFMEFSLSDMLCLYRDAAGLWWYGRYAAVIEALANLILNIILGRMFGVDGILTATIITFGAFTIGYYGFIIFKRYFGIEKAGRCIFDNFIYLIVIYLASLLTLRCCRMVGEFGISTLIVRGTVCLFIPNIIFMLCFCRYRYFGDAVKLIQSMIRLWRR